MDGRVVDMKPKFDKSSIKWIVIVVILLIVALLAYGSIVIVQPGHVGVVVHLGEVQPDAVPEGIFFKIPIIQEVVQVEVRVQKRESEQTAASRDLQIVSTNIVVNYHLINEEVPQLFKNVGLSYNDRVVDPAIAEAVKAVAAQFTAEQLITRRAEVSALIKEALQERFNSYNMILDEINITEFLFSVEFNNAIEQKQIAEQQALKAQLDLQRIEIEAEQTIESAKAEAEALRLQKEVISPDLISLRQIEAQIRAIDKWDGVLPSVTGDAVPFIDIESLQK